MRNRKKLIFIITGCCLLAGILYALFVPDEYQSKAKVLPEINNSPQGELGQLLQSYGGLLGLSGFSSANSTNKQYISPDIYPVIIHSLSFQSEMLQDTIYFGRLDSSMTLFQYFSREDNNTDISVHPDIPGSNIDSVAISSLTKPQIKAIEDLRERIQVTFDGSTGVMNVTVLMPDAVAAAQVCEKIIERLKTVVRKYHTRKAKNFLEYSNKQYQDARDKFLAAQNKLATFKDKHANLVTAMGQSRLKYLGSEYDLTYSVFSSVAQQRVEARMNLQKSIPVFNILQHPNIPIQRYSPRWIPVILISIAVGFVLSFLVVAWLFIYRK